MQLLVQDVLQLETRFIELRLVRARPLPGLLQIVQDVAVDGADLQKRERRVRLRGEEVAESSFTKSLPPTLPVRVTAVRGPL